jgi:two-component system cell cycle sensor histidine kinase/response regulator CckA
VITDLTMPNMTGDEMARQFISIRADIPIILCTGYSVRIREREARAFGVRAFIMKPVTLKDLSEKVRTVLDTRTSSPA